jgi:hypothetical protein
MHMQKFANIVKKAFQIQEAEGFLNKANKLYSDTAGRAKALPASLLVHQEDFLKDLKGPNIKTLKKELAHLQKDERLKDVVVRLGHVDPVQNFLRSSKVLGPQLALLTQPVQLLNAAAMAAGRLDNYDPLTNTVHLYSGTPEVAHHELGHARDFNQSQTDKYLKTLGLGLGRHIFGGLSPVTQYLETRANEEAEAGYKGDMRQFRRRLWPARGTYWAGAGFGAGMVFSPEFRNKVYDFVAKTPEDNWWNNPYTRSTLVGLATAGTGSISGRIIAEIRNLFDSTGKKENKTK